MQLQLPAKFSHLQPYFQGCLTLEDLSRFTAQQLHQVATPHDKLSMMLLTQDPSFWRFLKSPPAITPTTHFTRVVPVGGTLDLTGRVWPGFVALNARTPPPSVVFSRDLVPTLESIQFDFNAVKRLICSSNLCRDTDLTHIFELVKRCPNCRDVDLSNNNFYGGGPTKESFEASFFELLSLEHIKKIVLLANPIAALTKKELFSRLTKVDIQKLVWIPQVKFFFLFGQRFEERLKTATWHPMVPEHVIEIVFQAHVEYYESPANK